MGASIYSQTLTNQVSNPVRYYSQYFRQKYICACAKTLLMESEASTSCHTLWRSGGVDGVEILDFKVTILFNVK